MNVLLIELVLWSGLLAFIWALRERPGKVEADIETSNGARRHPRVPKPKGKMAIPDQRRELIGRYQNHDIYRFIVVQGEAHGFDRVCPPSTKSTACVDELYVRPGLIYRFTPDDVLPEKSS